MKLTRGRMQDLLSQFALLNATTRAKLIAEPRRVIAKQVGVEVPRHITIEVLEESADTVYLIVPSADHDAELAAADLDAIAGGQGDTTSAGTGSGVDSTGIGDKTATCTGGSGLMATRQIYDI